MAGRRLIDAAKLFNASKSIAKQHINLRSQQLDVYNKTSTLARSVKNQTDRVTLTVNAAIELSKRFNESALSYTTTSASEHAPTGHDEAIPQKETVDGKKPRYDMKEDLEQNHHYDRSEQHSQGEGPPEKELGITQERSNRRPLPNGTISSSGLTSHEQSIKQDTFSQKSTPEPVNTPLAEEKQTGRQDEEEGIKPVASRASTTSAPPKLSDLTPDEARRLQRQSEFQIPSVATDIQSKTPHSSTEKLSEGHDRDVFYTRSAETKPQYSSLPRAKIPENTENKQGSGEHVQDGQINQDVFYATPEPGQKIAQKEQIPHQEAVTDQDQVPAGINTDVFRTARVAKMLGGNPYKDKTDLDLKGANRTLVDHIKIAAGKDQNSFNVRQSVATAPAQLKPILSNGLSSNEKEMHDFASELAKSANAAPLPISELSRRYPEE